jgi:hypothetical protein
MFDPRTTPRPKIKERDVVVRQGTEQPRGVVLMSLFAIEDENLQGLRSAPIKPGWYALIMWHNRKRLVAELAEGLETVRSLKDDY